MIGPARMQDTLQSTHSELVQLIKLKLKVSKHNAHQMFDNINGRLWQAATVEQYYAKWFSA